MSRIELVTSFSAEGADLYGRRMVESVREFWPHPLTVYADEPMEIHGASVRLTSDIPGWLQTKAALPSMRPDAVKPTNYIWDAKRFAVKAFVWHDAAVRLGEGILVWLDGDTVASKPVPASLVEHVLGGGHAAYLGRGAMHPETGFVAFRIPEALPLLQWCRGSYQAGAFKRLKDGWTDCHVLRDGIRCLPVWANDLTSHAYDGEWRSGIDAMALSPLGPYVTHFKGPKRKREAA